MCLSAMFSLRCHSRWCQIKEASACALVLCSVYVATHGGVRSRRSQIDANKSPCFWLIVVFKGKDSLNAKRINKKTTIKEHV